MCIIPSSREGASTGVGSTKPLIVNLSYPKRTLSQVTFGIGTSLLTLAAASSIGGFSTLESGLHAFSLHKISIFGLAGLHFHGRFSLRGGMFKIANNFGYKLLSPKHFIVRELEYLLPLALPT